MILIKFKNDCYMALLNLPFFLFLSSNPAIKTSKYTINSIKFKYRMIPKPEFLIWLY